MVSLPALQYLSSQKVKDASILLRNGRNNGAIYLMGYALEFSLKRKISLTFGFHHGFPETPAELNTYTAQVNLWNAVQTSIRLTRVTQIRNHRLDDLLTFSGVGPRIAAQYFGDWQHVNAWNPEDRYIRRRVSPVRAAEFMRSARVILREIA